VLRANEIRISMDGQGCWRDNVFIGRLWRSVKYEEVYLHDRHPNLRLREVLWRSRPRKRVNNLLDVISN